MCITKLCKHCGLEKSVAEFHKNAGRKDGLSNDCKPCAVARVVRWQEANQDREKSRKKLWHSVNSVRCKEYGAAWREVNKDLSKALISRWRAANPEASRIYHRNRRAKIRACEGAHTPSDIGRLVVLQKNKCACCKINVGAGYHVDHIMPLALGGGNDRHNLQLLCPACNQQKHAKHPVEFMQQKGYLI